MGAADLSPCPAARPLRPARLPPQALDGGHRGGEAAGRARAESAAGRLDRALEQDAQQKVLLLQGHGQAELGHPHHPGPDPGRCGSTPAPP